MICCAYGAYGAIYRTKNRYRGHTNTRMHPGGDYYFGRPYEVCEVGSRWHTYAFDWYDRGKVVVMKPAAHGVFQLFVDEVLRTEATTFMGQTWTVDHADMYVLIRCYL